MRVLLCASSLRSLDGVSAHLETLAGNMLRDGADVHVLATHPDHARDAYDSKSYLIPKLLGMRGCSIIPPNEASSIASVSWDFCVAYSRQAADILGESLPRARKLVVHLDRRACEKAVTYRNTLHLGSTEEACAALIGAGHVQPDRVRLLRVPIDSRRFRAGAPAAEIRRILVVGRRPRLGAVRGFARTIGAVVAASGADSGDVTARCFHIQTPWRASKSGPARDRRCEYNIEKLMRESDLVVATGRAVYEAMLCGRPVLVHNTGASGECLIRDEPSFARLVETNCSGRLLGKRFGTAAEIEAEMRGYNPSCGKSMRGWAKSRFDADMIYRRMLEMVEEAGHA